MSHKNRRGPSTEEEDLLRSLSDSQSAKADDDSKAKLAGSTKTSALDGFTPPPRRGGKNTTRGRVDIVRQTAHRGGKVVIVVSGFKGIGLPEKQALAKKMQKVCGAGGTVKEGRIEIQGDKRDEVRDVLIEAGFNPVFAGG